MSLPLDGISLTIFKTCMLKGCIMFSLVQLKRAREVLYKTCEPDVHYSYQGPHAST